MRLHLLGHHLLPLRGPLVRLSAAAATVTTIHLLTASCGSDAPSSTFEPDASTDGSGAGDGPGPIVPSEDFAAPVIDTGAPANAPALFAVPNVSGGTGPCVYEPEMGSLFPKNWMRARFRVTPANNENLFEIKLVVPNQKHPLLIYTTTPSYTLSDVAWKVITRKGGEGPIHVTVRSAVLAGDKLTTGPWLGNEGDIEIAPVEAPGSIVYWSTSSGSSLRGFKVGQEDVRTVVTPAQTSGACVACHTSTPDGLFVGFSSGQNPNDGHDANAGIRSVDGNASEPPYMTASAKNLAKRLRQHAPFFSKGHWGPGDRIMGSLFGTANQYDIIWTNLEAASETQNEGWGIFARTGDLGSAAGASMSRDGSRIVYFSASSTGAGTIVGDGIPSDIFTIPYAARAGGPATKLAGASDPAFNEFYPAFSSDDALVAFNRVEGQKTSYNQALAELFVVPSAGGAAIRLVANDPPACTNKKSPGMTNSWPKWSPEAPSGPDNKKYYFVVFSSTRNPTSAGKPQVYVAPIVVDGATITTKAALYFWNQPENEGNHTPAWDVFDLPGPK